MKTSIILSGLSCLFLITTSQSIANAAENISTLPQAVEAEGNSLDASGLMTNAINYHRCLSHDQVVEDIHRILLSDNGVSLKNQNLSIDEDSFNAIFAKYNRDQIITAEIAQLNEMQNSESIIPHYTDWQANLKKAKDAGNMADYDAYLAATPLVAVATFFELILAGPFAIINRIIDTLDSKSCNPIAESN